ncbi:MAG: pyridoxal phosphate enzyme (YggS family) [Alteromonadaceae bacterium]|jgi:pyridoxal phosphate enzyme (YggS family)
MINIADRLHFAHAQLKQISEKYHRPANAVDLLAVSKTKPIELIIAAYEQGQRKFGENYASETAEKIEAFKQIDKYTDIEWHFIGPLQSNKTRLIANDCQWVHSIDRLKIAQRLNDQRNPELPPLNVLIQVNISNEASKAGVSAEQISELAVAIGQMPRLKLRGLMAIPQKTGSISEQKSAFLQVNDCFVQLATQHTDIDTLSMGMSSDLDAAIAAGSTMVRIGTAIFGARE